MKNNKAHNNFLDRLLLNRWLYIVLILMFLAFSCLCFKWGHEIYMFNKDCTIDHELWGTYGDFFGGVLGTIFTLISVLLVVKTFRYQQEVTQYSIEQQKTQQFNNLFFELLHLYQEEVKDLCGCLEKITDIRKSSDKDSFKVTKEEVRYDNKDFFDEEKCKIQDDYQNLASYEKNRMKSLNHYMFFYVKNRGKVAAYFRTLYRMFELIDKTNLIEDFRKKEYAKIIRAQLTESELFFLRYNALTIYGKPFVEYLNRYHVLKHLPAFELLEFKDWWKEMNQEEREGINIVYYAISCALKDLFKTKENESKINILPQKEARFNVFLLLKNHSDFSILIEKNLSIENKLKEYMGLDKLEDKRIQQLLDCFIKEIFLFSNFRQFNDESDIQTYSNSIIKDNNIVKIDSGIRNIKGRSLIYMYEQYEQFVL